MDAQTDSQAPIRTALGDDARASIDSEDLRAVLSNLSHELCRPLMSLRAGFDLLLTDEERPISRGRRGHVQTMTGLCDDLLRLTRTYIDYAGLVQGTRPIDLGEFTIGALVAEVDRQSEGVAADRRITWSCFLEGPDSTVSTDVSCCQRVLGNLVANALKYTPEGGEVCVVAKLEGASWTVTVTDDGPGIPGEHLERVFEPFYRLPRSENSPAVGDGLGLAVCRELVEQLGGTIDLRPAPGQGIRAVVRFPVAIPGPIKSKSRPRQAGPRGSGR